MESPEFGTQKLDKILMCFKDIQIKSFHPISVIIQIKLLLAPKIALA